MTICPMTNKNDIVSFNDKKINYHLSNGKQKGITICPIAKKNNDSFSNEKIKNNNSSSNDKKTR